MWEGWPGCGVVGEAMLVLIGKQFFPENHPLLTSQSALLVWASLKPGANNLSDEKCKTLI